MTVSLKLHDICKQYGIANPTRTGGRASVPAASSGRLDVLRGVSLEMSAGQNLAIMGPSGSGKSTLLHLIGTLDTPTSGMVEINGQNPFQLPEPELAKFRNRIIGFVFQSHHLLPQYNALENVLLPALASPDNSKGSIEKARSLLERVGLADRMLHLPFQLSGGESQRVAVARALINQPSLLLCDEPTGNLDEDTAESVADLLFDLHKQENNILIAVTHNPDLARRFDRSLRLAQGILKV